jgi:hypothetical protein
VHNCPLQHVVVLVVGGCRPHAAYLRGMFTHQMLELELPAHQTTVTESTDSKGSILKDNALCGVEVSSRSSRCMQSGHVLQ